MNQILATHNNSNNKRAPLDTKKIIVFFCIAIIVFGVLIISVAAYNLYISGKEKKEKKEVKDPEITLEQIEESIKIVAEYENGISNIKYNWNDNDAYEVPAYGTTKMEKLIDLTENEGENLLKVEVIGEDGRTKEFSKMFIVEKEEEPETNGPKIQWVIKYNENKINAIATDDIKLKYIKYQWDNNDAILVEATEETSKQIEVDIDIERGQHKLVITAEDIDGNIATKSGNFKGVKKPEIAAIRYDDTVELTISHDMGFKKIEFIVNDQVYVYDKNYAGYNEEIINLLYKVKLKEGENVIQVTAESLETINTETDDGTVQVYKGKCVYTPPIVTNE